MNLNAVLEVVTGLALMYLMLSLLVTVLNEKVATLTSLRAATLRDGVQKLAQDTPLTQVLASPLVGIKATDRPATRPLRDRIADGLDKVPGLGWMGAMVATPPGGPSYVSGQNFALAVLDFLNPATQASDTETYKAILSGIDKLPENSDREKEFKTHMRAVINNAAGSVTHVRDSVAAWFDSHMDRVQGEYKRAMQLISLAIGLLVAIAFNADTLQVAKSLWQQPTMRAAVGDNAQAVFDQLTRTKDAAGNPIPGAMTEAEIRSQLTNLPLGWHHGEWNRTWKPTREGFAWKATMLKVLGMLVTAFALALGAPFWFDTLGKVVNLRGAGARPAETPMPRPATT